MRQIVLRALYAALLVLITSTAADASWSFEAHGGTAFNFRTPLVIRQAGHENINISAIYEEKPLENSPYFALRIGRWEQGRAWELELIHHKIYLNNNPSEVENFEISHGYNLLMVNRALAGRFDYRIGVGAVLSHPESIIRGQENPTDGGFMESGFYVSGAAVQGAIGKKHYVLKNLFVSAEGKLTVASAVVPVRGGSAEAPNIAAHILLGVGYSTGGRAYPSSTTQATP